MGAGADRGRRLPRRSLASAEGLRVGVIEKTLDPERSDRATLTGVERAARALGEAGALVEKVSVPMWYHAWAIWAGILVGGMPPMMRSDGVSSGHRGYVDIGRAHTAALTRREEANLLSPMIKVVMIANTYVEQQYFNTTFGKAINQRIVITRQLDDVLSRYDVLLTPTTPTTATPLPAGRLTAEELMTGAVDQSPFTSPLNLSGHPAVAVPSGQDAEGLPTSVQIVASRFDEHQALRAAFAVESLLDLELGRVEARAR